MPLNASNYKLAPAPKLCANNWRVKWIHASKNRARSWPRAFASVELAEQQTFETALAASVDAALTVCAFPRKLPPPAPNKLAANLKNRASSCDPPWKKPRAAGRKCFPARTTGCRIGDSTGCNLPPIALANKSGDGAIEQGEHTWRTRMESDLTEAQKRAAAHASESIGASGSESAARIAQQSEQEMARLQTQATEKSDPLHRQGRRELDAQACAHSRRFPRTMGAGISSRPCIALDEIQNASGNLDKLVREILS